MYYERNKMNMDDAERTEIKLILKFLKNSSSVIFGMLNNKDLNQGFHGAFAGNNKYRFELKGWVSTVEDDFKVVIKQVNSTLRSEKETLELWVKLRSSGLAGVQLESKLNYWEVFYKRLKRWLKDLSRNGKDMIDKLNNAPLLPFLKATNILYKSLLSALPGLEPLIELKDFFELSLEEIG